jgi:hypothetical protein
MSNPTTVAARSVPVAISTDGVTYKNAVCKKLWNLTLEKVTTEEESDCGTHAEVGATKITVDFEFILNTTPNGATEWGSDSVINWADAGTLVYIKLTSGSTYFRSVSGYFTNYTEAAPQGGLVAATVSFKGTGTIDTSA